MFVISRCSAIRKENPFPVTLEHWVRLDVRGTAGLGILDTGLGARGTGLGILDVKLDARGAGLGYIR